MRIMLVEDDLPLAEALTTLLVQSGHAVDAVHDGASAEALAAADATLGALVGQPCVLAADILAAMRTDAWSCEIDGGDAFVTLRVPFGPVHVDVRSRAGIAD